MKRTDKVTTAIALLLFIAFAAYLGVYTYRALSDKTVTADASLTSVTVGCNASGIVVRSETVLESGELYLDVTAANGARVSRGGAIATAMSSDAGLQRAARMHELELEISRISAALGAGSADDLTTRDASLRKALLSLTASVADSDFSDLDSDCMNLASLVIDNAFSDNASDLAALRAELESLRSSSSSDTRTLTAEESGIFSTVVDGYEHLSPADLENLTPSALQELIDSRSTVGSAAYGKLITDYNWYFAAAMASADAANLTVGRTARLNFGKYCGSPVNAVVRSIGSSEKGSTVVVFRCTSALGDTLPMRTVTAEVIFEEYEGIRVPSQAIRTDSESEGTYVWVITAMQLERKDVEIIYAGDGFCLVSRGSASDSLREGNTLVVSGTDLYEGKLME